MRALKRAGLIVAASLVSLLIGLLAAEAAIRVFSLAPPLVKVFGGYAPDPYLPYKMKSLNHETGQTTEFRYDYRHNSAGFRDTEHDKVKAPGTFRILGLGDSFTYGVGALFEETYRKLEEKLNKRTGNQYRGDQAGIPRYFP
jgi:hypothetical protein